jgi:hypothetical protein
MIEGYLFLTNGSRSGSRRPKGSDGSGSTTTGEQHIYDAGGHHGDSEAAGAGCTAAVSAHQLHPAELHRKPSCRDLAGHEVPEGISMD